MISNKAYGYGSAKSAIRELAGYGAKRAKEIGPENVMNFTIGNPSVPAPKEVSDAIEDIIKNNSPNIYNSYTAANGREETRKAIADNLNKRYGTGYGPGNFFLVCGAAAGLTSAISALLAEEDSEIMVLAPNFPEYKVFIEGNGGVMNWVSAADDMRFNYEAIQKQLNEKVQAVIVNSPNNPSGVIFSEEEMKKFCQILEEKEKEYGHPIYIITDEPYRELVLVDGVKVPWVPSLYDNTIVVYSWSKSLSLPGERIGYVLVPDAVADKNLMAAVAGAARSMGYVCAPALFQMVIERCVDVKPNIEVYKRNRDILYENLTEMGYTVADPAGAFYLFIKAPDGNAEEFSKKAMAHDLLLVPGTSFGAPTHLRLSFCVDTEKIEKSIPIFKELMKEYQ